MTKRFNNLNAALKYLRPTTAAIDAPTPDAPTGSQLKQFQDFKAGKLNITYVREANSNQIAIDNVALLPFANGSASTDKFIVPISRRALNGIALAGISVDILNISTTLTGADIISGFTPARATVRNTVGTTPTPKDSKITGAPYKKRGESKSYTFPFGTKITNGSYAEIRGAIIAGVSDADTNRSVSFQNEILR
ncbi:MAG: hypothetical protein V7K26_00085 [Nostoc sp.]|uniref:hypothetical protein n=1 Tax=Nostoc sp. TaxID=1180 RepID=UPI002FEFBC3B